MLPLAHDRARIESSIVKIDNIPVHRRRGVFELSNTPTIRRLKREECLHSTSEIIAEGILGFITELRHSPQARRNTANIREGILGPERSTLWNGSWNATFNPLSRQRKRKGAQGIRFATPSPVAAPRRAARRGDRGQG